MKNSFLFVCLLATITISPILASPIGLPSNISRLSDETEKQPITWEDVIVNGIGSRGFSGTWISGKRK